MKNMSNKKINIALAIYVVSIAILCLVAFYAHSWKIVISGSSLFTMLMYYASLKFKRKHN